MSDAYAEAFGGDDDPLGEHEGKFREIEAAGNPPPLKKYLNEQVEPRDLKKVSKDRHRRSIRQFRKHMKSEGRHPSCATEAHAKRWIDALLEKNSVGTVKQKVRYVEKGFAWLSRNNNMPHGEFNPVGKAHTNYIYDTEKIAESEAERPSRGDMPYIKDENLREIFGEIPHIRTRALILTQLKLGLRAGTASNIRLEDIAINHDEVSRYYPELGTHEGLNGHENALYVPCERPETKSQRNRLLPLTPETHRALLAYLRLRPRPTDPDADHGWFFVSENHRKIGAQTATRIWNESFWPAAEKIGIEQPDLTASHYGRKHFAEHWKVKTDALSREQVQWLRGDKLGGDGANGRHESIDAYLSAYNPIRYISARKVGSIFG
jgi:integrase/recombinase XerD